ncbi:hypothetical protein V1509DRAFT_675552 [Lipomyces kononenkoae]
MISTIKDKQHELCKFLQAAIIMVLAVSELTSSSDGQLNIVSSRLTDEDFYLRFANRHFIPGSGTTSAGQFVHNAGQGPQVAHLSFANSCPVAAGVSTLLSEFRPCCPAVFPSATRSYHVSPSKTCPALELPSLTVVLPQSVLRVDEDNTRVIAESAVRSRSNHRSPAAVTPAGLYDHDDRGYADDSFPASVSPSVASQADPEGHAQPGGRVVGAQATCYTGQSVAHETVDEQPYNYYPETPNVGIRYSTLLGNVVGAVDSVESVSEQTEPVNSHIGRGGDDGSGGANTAFPSITFEQNPESVHTAYLSSYFAAGGGSMFSSDGGYFVEPAAAAAAHHSSQHNQTVIGSPVPVQQYQSQSTETTQGSYYPIDTVTSSSVPATYTNLHQIQSTLVSLLQYITASPSSTPSIATDIMPRLANISRYLGEHAIDLGLADDRSLPYDARLQFWRLFNRSWIGVISRNWLMSGGGLTVAQGPTSLTRQQLEEMAEIMISLSDNVQRYGLVDYEVGVWEDHILDGMH